MSWFVTYWQKTLMIRAHKTVQTGSSDTQLNILFLGIECNYGTINDFDANDDDNEKAEVKILISATQ